MIGSKTRRARLRAPWIVLVAAAWVGPALARDVSVVRQAVVRARPEPLAPVLAVVPPAGIVFLHEESDGWVRVSTREGRTGFVAGSVTGPTLTPVQRRPPATAALPGMLRVAVDAVLRLSPAEGSRAMGSLAAGTDVGVVSRLGDWLEVVAPGQGSGWIDMVATPVSVAPEGEAVSPETDETDEADATSGGEPAIAADPAADAGAERRALLEARLALRAEREAAAAAARSETPSDDAARREREAAAAARKAEAEEQRRIREEAAAARMAEAEEQRRIREEAAAARKAEAEEQRRVRGEAAAARKAAEAAEAEPAAKEPEPEPAAEAAEPVAPDDAAAARKAAAEQQRREREEAAAARKAEAEEQRRIREEAAAERKAQAEAERAARAARETESSTPEPPEAGVDTKAPAETDRAAREEAARTARETAAAEKKAQAEAERAAREAAAAEKKAQAEAERAARDEAERLEKERVEEMLRAAEAAEASRVPPPPVDIPAAVPVEMDKKAPSDRKLDPADNPLVQLGVPVAAPAPAPPPPGTFDAEGQIERSIAALHEDRDRALGLSTGEAQPRPAAASTYIRDDARAVPTSVVSRIVARVNDEILTNDEFDRRVEEAMDEFRRSGRGELAPAEFEDLRRRLLNRMVEQLLLLEEGRLLGLPFPKVYEAAKARFMSQAGIGDDLQLVQLLEATGRSWDDFRRELLRESVPPAVLKSQVYRHVTVPEDDVVTHYRLHQESWGEEACVRIREIVLQPEPRERTRDFSQRLERLLGSLEAGGDFCELATRVSKAPSAQDCGLLPTCFTRSQLDEKVALVAFRMKPGDIEPITTDWGYHVIRLEEIKPRRSRPIEEVRDQIVEKLRSERASEEVRRYVDRLRSSADIELAPEFRAMLEGSPRMGSARQ